MDDTQAEIQKLRKERRLLRKEQDEVEHRLAMLAIKIGIMIWVLIVLFKAL